MNNTETLELLGFHGTNSANEQSILSNCFIKSSSMRDWYGTGCYFFIEGISEDHPSVLATKWAIDSAWNNEKKAYDYSSYIVFEANVKILDSEVLDMTKDGGLQLFNIFRNKSFEKFTNEGKKLKARDLMDSHVFEIMKQKLNIKVIIGNVFIKFADIRKVSGLRSNVPNVTMMCVDNTENQHIEVSNLKISKKGEITI